MVAGSAGARSRGSDTMNVPVLLAVAVAGSEIVRMLCPVVTVSAVGVVMVMVVGVVRGTLLAVAVALFEMLIA